MPGATAKCATWAASPADCEAVSKALRRLVSAGQRLHIVYEAGPCGFVLQRHLTALGWHCEVVAPSSIPQALGRSRQDRPARRHDAGPAGALRRAERRARARRRPTKRCATWCAPARTPCASSATRATASRRCCCATASPTPARAPGRPRTCAGWPRLSCQHAAQQIAFQEYLHAITEAAARIARLEQALRDALPDWTLAPLVAALQALRGVQLIAAMTLVAEMQDFLRFANPRQLMAYVGLVPGEHSSGPAPPPGRHHQGGQLGRPAHAGGGRLAPTTPRTRERRHCDAPGRAAQGGHRHRLGRAAAAVRAVQAPGRAPGMKTKVVVAIARELAGFVWAIAREVSSARERNRRLSARRTTSAKGGASPTHATMPERERGAATATGEPSTTLLASHLTVRRSQTLERRQPRDAHICR